MIKLIERTQSEFITINMKKVKELAEIISNNVKIPSSWDDRADYVDIYSNGLQEVDISAVIYVVSGLEDGEDYQIFNNSIQCVDPTDERWNSVRKYIGGE